jgi:hypothetical protein
MLDSLPNCVFDANGPLRSYTAQSRVAAFFSKAAELSAVGLLTGAARHSARHTTNHSPSPRHCPAHA